MYLNNSNKAGKLEKCNIYDMKWNLQVFSQHSLPTKEKYDKPKQLGKMKEIAQKLAQKYHIYKD